MVKKKKISLASLFDTAAVKDSWPDKKSMVKVNLVISVTAVTPG